MLPCGTLLVILIALTCVMMAPTSLHKDDWTSPLTSYDLEKIYTQLATIPILCDDPQSTELYAKVLKDVSDVQESILDNWCDRCFQQSIDASYLLPGVHLQGDPLSIFNYKPLPKPSQPYYVGPQARRFYKDDGMHLPEHFKHELEFFSNNIVDLQLWTLDPFYVNRDQYYEMRMAITDDAWFGIAYRTTDRVVLPFGLLKLSSTVLNVDGEKNIPCGTDRSVMCRIMRSRADRKSKERVVGEYRFTFYNPFIDDVWFPILLTKRQTRTRAIPSGINPEILEYPCNIMILPCLPKSHESSVLSHDWGIGDVGTSHPILVDISFHPAHPTVDDTFLIREKLYRSGSNTDDILDEEPIGKANARFNHVYEAHWNDWVAQKLLELRSQKNLQPFDYKELSEAAFQVPLVQHPTFDAEIYQILQKESMAAFRKRREEADRQAEAVQYG